MAGEIRSTGSSGRVAPTEGVHQLGEVGEAKPNAVPLMSHQPTTALLDLAGSAATLESTIGPRAVPAVSLLYGKSSAVKTALLDHMMRVIVAVGPLTNSPPSL